MEDELEKEYHKPLLLEDLGMRFSSENSKQKIRYGIFKCFCGKEFEAIMSNIKRGHTKSCGCLKTNIDKIIHRLSGHRLYGVWNDMLRRCNNSNSKAYKYYGERGISVCERWYLLENFIEDMFPTFKEGLTLDRIDVEGNYEPNNCRWATKSVQSRNKQLLCSTNTSGFRGVCWNKARSKWVTQIKVNNKKVHLGYFNTAVEGAIAYNNYVIENNLEHPLNIIPESV